jgi:hypothetical protein
MSQSLRDDVAPELDADTLEAMPTRGVELSTLFLGLQRQMEATLMTNRENVSHPGTQGDGTELCWLEMLRNYLPKRYRAEKAFVLDARGGISEQIDIVILDRQYSPLLFNQHGAFYVPAESVYAVIEVKPACDKGNIEYAGKKAASVRDLHRTHAPIYHAGGVIQETKEPFGIAAGIVALESGWSPPLGASFESAMAGLPAERAIDFGCVLRSGAFNVMPGDEKSRRIHVSDDSTALVSFFLNLLSRLQKLGTVPAIDISEYAKSVNSERSAR